MKSAIFDKSAFEALMEDIRVTQDDVNQSAVLICREGKNTHVAVSTHTLTRATDITNLSLFQNHAPGIQS